MLVISLAAILTFIVTALLMLAAAGRLPFGVRSGNAVLSAASDKDIFRQQMAELEKMRAAGLLGEDSAKEARLELARRILAAEKHMKDGQNISGKGEVAFVPRESQLGGSDLQSRDLQKCGSAGGTEKAHGLAGGRSGAGNARKRGFLLFLSLALFFIPLFSGIVYYYQGRPEQAARPFAVFMARNPDSLNRQEKIVRLGALAARNPRNSGLADDLAAAYLQAGRFQNAANSYNHAIALGGETAGRLLGYALALTGFEDGVVGKDAEAAFRNVLRLDPQNSQAQLFLARGLVQSGRRQEAIALLQGFLRQAPPNSPWQKNLQAAIAAVENPQAAAPVAALTPEQRDFIAANLGRLETRVKAEPGNLQAWTMLLNAYLLLGRADYAQTALQKGLAAMPLAEAKQLGAYARQKGLAVPGDAVPGYTVPDDTAKMQ